MKRLILLLCCIVSLARGATYYVTQAGAGTNSGADLANAKSIPQINAFTLSPGDTVILNGNITKTLGVAQNGSSGNPITILWATGAKITTPASMGIYAASR